MKEEEEEEEEERLDRKRITQTGQEVVYSEMERRACNDMGC